MSRGESSLTVRVNFTQKEKKKKKSKMPYKGISVMRQATSTNVSNLIKGEGN